MARNAIEAIVMSAVSHAKQSPINYKSRSTHFKDRMLRCACLSLLTGSITPFNRPKMTSLPVTEHVTFKLFLLHPPTVSATCSLATVTSGSALHSHHRHVIRRHRGGYAKLWANGRNELLRRSHVVGKCPTSCYRQGEQRLNQRRCESKSAWGQNQFVRQTYR